MFIDRNIKLKDILIFILVGLIGYKVIDNFEIILNIIKKILSVCSPIIYSLLFAYILNPIMEIFETKLKLRRGLAITLTYTIICAICTVFTIYIIPSIIDSIVSISLDIPEYMNTVQQWINELLKNQDIYEMFTDVGLLDNITLISSKLGSIIIGILHGSVSSILAVAANLVKVLLGLLISIYVLLDKERFIKESKTITYIIFKEDKGSKLIELVRTYHRMIGIYIGTKALDSLIIGIMALIGLIILKAPYAILIAIVVGITNMIPYFGPFIGELVGAFIGIFVSPMMAISIFLFLLILQQFDAWYLDPKLIGAKVGVRPFTLIMAITIGGGLFGAIGMLLASPTMATIKIVYDRKVNKFKENHKEIAKKLESDEANENEINEDENKE